MPSSAPCLPKRVDDGADPPAGGQIKSVKESEQALQAQVAGLSSEVGDARGKAAQLRTALDEAHAHTARFREVAHAPVCAVLLVEARHGGLKRFVVRAVPCGLCTLMLRSCCCFCGGSAALLLWYHDVLGPSVTAAS
jgi:hypothetical protein